VCNGSTRTGAGASPADCGTNLGQWGYQIFHAETPETETTTHQFWAEAHPRGNIAPDKLQGFQDAMRNIIAEDLDVYVGQQAAIDLDPEALNRDANPRGTLDADAALLEMRRVIRRLHGEEQKLAGDTNGH
jgi:vanillate O-demethylase monooxygenase subunit